MEIASIISIIAVCLTAITFLVTQGRRSGHLEADIKHIAKTVDEIKSEQSGLKDDIKILSERLVAVEQSTKSAHKRIDTLEVKRTVKTVKE